jgi:hypothetical protein
LAELNDADTLDVSCYLTSDGWQPSLDQAVATDDRLCDTVTYESRGRSQRSLGIRYVENPSDSPNNEAYDAFVPGTTGVFVVRRGYLYTAAWAAGQKYQYWPVDFGDYDWQPPEANTVLHVAQKPFVIGAVKLGTVHA